MEVCELMTLFTLISFLRMSFHQVSYFFGTFVSLFQNLPFATFILISPYFLFWTESQYLYNALSLLSSAVSSSSSANHNETDEASLPEWSQYWEVIGDAFVQLEVQAIIVSWQHTSPQL